MQTTGYYLSQLDQQSLMLYRTYERHLTSFNRRKIQLRFLQDCRAEQVTPKHFDVKLFEHGEPYSQIKKLIIQDAITNCKSEIEDSHFYVRRGYSNLRYFVHPCLLKHIVDIAHNTARHVSSRHETRLNDRLHSLCKHSTWNKFTVRNSVINLSTHQLSEDQHILLGFALNFSLPPSQRDTIATATCFENFTFRYRDQLINPDLIRGAAIPFLASLSKHHYLLPKRFNRSMQELRQNDDIVVFPADKGGKVVILDTTDYKQKAINLLSDDNIYQQVTRDPTSAFNSKFRKTVKELANDCPDPAFFNTFLKTYASLPYMYGIPKLHKDNCPLRPIISTVGSCLHALASWLASTLSPYLGVFSDSHLKHSMEFTQRLATHNSVVPMKMLSLDVTSLFTNVPLDDVLVFIKQKFDEGILQIPIPIDPFF
jgi:hypothetical protein